MFRRPGRGRVLLLVFLALSILVITLDYRSGNDGILKRAREWSVAVVAPIQRGFTTVVRPIGNFFSAVGDIANLRERVNRLEDENSQLRAENEQSDSVLEENLRLTQILELQKSWPAMETAAAQVISDDPGNYNWAIQIDAGRADGVRRDMAVLAPEGYLVGRVTRVTEHQAIVLVIVDPNAAAGARVEGVRDRGTITGNGAGNPLSMLYVGKNSDVEAGDSVETSGLDDVFPPAIPVGTVIRSEIQGGDTSKTIEVQPFIDYGKLDFVLVLLETGPRDQGFAKGEGK